MAKAKIEGTVTLTLESYEAIISELRDYRDAVKLSEGWSGSLEIVVDLSPWESKIDEKFYKNKSFTERYYPLDWGKTVQVSSGYLFTRIPEEQKKELESGAEEIEVEEGDVL